MDPTILTRRRIEMRGGRVTAEIAGRPSLVVASEPVVVGRAPACQLVVPHPSVSAVHAELTATPRGLRVRDLGSKNGVWSGQLRVTEGLLVEADAVWIGDVEMTFEPVAPERVELPAVESLDRLYGRSASMRELFLRVTQSAPTDLTVLIQGETGTGKELVARAIHARSPRAELPFVVIDCGSLTPSLAETALFGHERGAFTGASQRRVSPFVEAAGGTVFLDELGELPLDVQPKLLRALAERRVKPVGGQAYIPFDARVVAATRRDLPSAVSAGDFRSDLFFRVAQLRIDVAPLRQRVEDIPGLVRHILAELGVPSAWKRVSRAGLDRLLRYPWPGNVRELRSAVAVAVALASSTGPLDIAAHAELADARVVSDAKLYANRGVGRAYHDAKRVAIDQFERAFFARLLAESGGNITELSRRAGLQRTHVRRYLQRQGLLSPTKRSATGTRARRGAK